MDNYQRALNYETVVRALQKADGYCWDLFLQVGNECDTREELPYNVGTYAEVLGVDRPILNEAYSRCRYRFERMDTDVTIIDPSSPLWPEDVTGIPFLYLKGDSSLLGTIGISVVGTRSPSNRGIALAREVVDSLGESGFTIVSGLAKGIDGVAHIEALMKDFKTIGVIGTSVSDVYPPEHVKLQGLVAENGLLVSQFAPSRKVERYFFMQRNLLMSQLAHGSFVIEDRDGGGGVKQAQYSEKASKKVFVLRETYENRSFLWPRKFKEPIIVNLARNAGGTAKKELNPAKPSGPRKGARKKAGEPNLQPELF